MPRPLSNPPALPLPPQPDLDLWPRHITAQQAAQIESHYFGPQSDRTIREWWPLVWSDFGGRGVTPVAGVLAEAQRRFDAPPAKRQKQRQELTAGHHAEV